MISLPDKWLFGLAFSPQKKYLSELLIVLLTLTKTEVHVKYLQTSLVFEH